MDNPIIFYLEEGTNFWEYKPNEPVPNDPNVSHIFDYVQFKRGKIVMENNARILLLNDARFITTRVEPLNYQHTPLGILPFNFCDIVGSSFYRIDIFAQLNFAAGGALYLTNSDFDQSDMIVRGYGMRVRDCLLEHSNIQLEESTVSSSVHNSIFRYNTNISDFSGAFYLQNQF